MAERQLPLSVFHFDCFWMREFNWCDFEWDPRVFPDPEGMLDRLHAKGPPSLRLDQPVHRAALAAVRRSADAATSCGGPTASVWQWDLWQAGHGCRRLHEPGRGAWFQGKLRHLVDQGVDCVQDGLR